jgi:hypothetical protein
MKPPNGSDWQQADSSFPPERSSRARAFLWALGGGIGLGSIIFLVGLTSSMETAIKSGAFAFYLGAVGGAFASGVRSLPPRYSTLEELGELPPARRSTPGGPPIVEVDEAFEMEFEARESEDLDAEN